MSNVAIKASGLGKRYLIGHQEERATTLRDSVAQSVSAMRRNIGRTLKGQQLLAGDTVEEFWALQDLDFEIPRGDVMGVVGRNGAGKSTLLKILSRITDPSTGRAEINGRVASLLEVGTGFHPELTGRENIFLNGAILGMSRVEIRSKLDQIVDFSGVEKFLDTPVKRYSSGMSVRLAFSVAAHLEPEILIVDEVLAVGDAEFQRKSLGKMEQVANDGRTVLIVSHNQGSLRNLCKSGMLLQNGRLIMTGTIDEVLTRYSGEYEENETTVSDNSRNALIFTKFRLESPANTPRRAVSGAPCDFVISYKGDPEKASRVTFGVGVIDPTGVRLSHLNSQDYGKTYAVERDGEIRIHFDRLPFAAGRYMLNLNATIDRTHLNHVPNAAIIEIESGDFLKNGIVSKWTQVGPVLVEHTWE